MPAAVRLPAAGAAERAGRRPRHVDGHGQREGRAAAPDRAFGKAWLDSEAGLAPAGGTLLARDRGAGRL